VRRGRETTPLNETLGKKKKVSPLRRKTAKWKKCGTSKRKSGVFVAGHLEKREEKAKTGGNRKLLSSTAGA